MRVEGLRFKAWGGVLRVEGLRFKMRFRVEG